jgi:cytidyltransferase-like protein
MANIVLVTGGFDPLHSGHIAYFESAKALGDKLVVGLNSDKWLSRKKGKSFMPLNERLSIVKNLRMVDEVIEFDDDDDTACDAIKQLINSTDKIIFANGGDRTKHNIPEMVFENVDFRFSVGGDDKKNSSSWILKEWQAPRVNRSWGHYRNLYRGLDFRVKELVIAPHSKLSMQKHKFRNETWNLVSGNAYILTSLSNVDPFDGAKKNILDKHNSLNVMSEVWHQGCNDTDEPAHIIEVWTGLDDKLTEKDIKRYA